MSGVDAWWRQRWCYTDGGREAEATETATSSAGMKQQFSYATGAQPAAADTKKLSLNRRSTDRRDASHLGSKHESATMVMAEIENSAF